jgi:hypothetical protein
MADVSLRINSDTGDAEGGLRRVVKNYEALDAATRKAHLAAMTAHKEDKAATEELAQTKSRAYANISKSAAAAALAQEKAARDGFKAYATETRALTSIATKDAAARLAEWKSEQKAVDETKARVSLLGGAFGSLGLKGVAAIGAITAAIVKMDAANSEAREGVARIGEGMRGFAAGEPGSPQAKNYSLRAAAAHGKRMGLSPDEAAAAYDFSDQISGGDKVKRHTIAGKLMALQGMGVDAEEAQAAMAPMLRQGYTPEAAAGLVAAGMDQLGIKGNTAAKITTKADLYRGSATNALAAASVLQSKGMLIDKELPGAVEETGKALSDSKLATFMQKKYAAAGIDFKNVGTPQYLADVAAHAGTDPAKLKKRFGLSDEAAKGVSTLALNRNDFFAAQSSLAATPKNFAEDQYATMRKMPALHEYYAGKQRMADRQFNDMFGPNAKALREHGDMAREAGERYESNPWTRDFLTNSKGEANMLGKAVYKAENNPLLSAGAWVGNVALNEHLGPTQQQRRMVGEAFPNSGISAAPAGQLPDMMGSKFDALIQALGTTNAALAENTEATRQNSQSTGGEPASGASRKINRNAGI